MATTLEDTLKEYSISSTSGFVSPEAPPIDFSTWTLTPWISFARSIASGDALSTPGAFRHRISKDFPALSLPPNAPVEKKRLAYVCLTHIAHAYVLDAENLSSDSNTTLHTPSDHLPPSIAVPLQAIAADLDIPSYLTYASAVLWNWKTITGSPKPLISLTGTDAESYYICGLLDAERAGGKAVVCALEASRASAMASRLPRDDKTVAVVEKSLLGVHTSLLEATRLLSEIKDKCDPRIFVDCVRPFYAPLDSSKYPNGIFYETSSTDLMQGEWQELSSSIGGYIITQSTFVQALDILLGVVHENDESAKVDIESIIDNSRDAMPSDHARFLMDIESLPSIASFVRVAKVQDLPIESLIDAHAHSHNHDHDHDHDHDHGHGSDLHTSHHHPEQYDQPPNPTFTPSTTGQPSDNHDNTRDTDTLRTAYISVLDALIQYRSAQILHVETFFLPPSTSTDIISDEQPHSEDLGAILALFFGAMRDDTKKALETVRGVASVAK